jgi:formamidopyrimidine-DNA glycosylase
VPELPEVEVVRAGLVPFATGATVTRVDVLDERSLRRHPGLAEDFADRLTGSVLSAASRRGKYLWLPLDAGLTKMKENPAESSASGLFRPSAAVSPSFSLPRASTEALVVHLGMSGQVLLRPPGTQDALTRVRLELEHPEHGPLRLNFVDQRIFGSMAIDDLVPAADLPDDARFLAALRRRRTGVKRALLDQTLVSGIGNIYADEALWAARVHYDQPTDALSLPRAKALLAEVRAVLAKALAEGGTSFDAQYLNVNGESGYFSHSLNAYGQQGRPCPRCGRPIVRERFMNRGSHLCPRCQRLR